MSVGEERLEFEGTSDEVERVRWLASSAALFDPDIPLDKLLELIAAKARDMLGTRAASVLLFGRAADGTALSGVAPPGDGDRCLVPAELTAEVRRHARTVRLPSGGEDATSCLATPIYDEHGACIGVLSLVDRLEGDFRDEDEAIVERLASLAGAAIRNVDLYRGLRRQADELDALFTLSGAVASAASLDDVFDAALDALERALDVDRASVVLFDDSGSIHFSAWRGLSAEYRRRIDGSAPWKRHAKEVTPLVVDDVLADAEVADLHDAFGAEGIRSMLLVPLVHAGSILGRLVLYSANEAAFSPENVRLASGMASHVAGTVARRRVEDEVHSSRRQLAAIVQSSSDGITVQEADGRLVFANDAAAQLTGFDTAEELIATPAEQILSRFELLDHDGETPLGWDSLPGRLAFADAREFERVLCYRVRETGDRRWAMVRATPILAPDGSVEIVVNVFHEVTESRLAEERLRFLGEASRVLAASLDVEATLGEVARLAVPVLADYCLIDVLDAEGRLGRVSIHHADEHGKAILEELRERFPPTFNERHPASRAVATADPVLFEDVTDEVLAEASLEPGHLALYQRLKPRSYLVVPLVARGRVLGAVSLGMSARSDRHYGADDVVVARELADRAAVALDNAMLFAASREALAQLETVLVSAPVGIGFWDLDLRFVRVNDALAEINGLPPEAHVGRTLEEVVPDLADRLEPLYRRVLDTGRPVVHEESTGPVPGTPGDERHWFSSYFPVRTAEEETIGVGAVILEITERKRAEARLRESEERFRTLADTIPALVWMCDQDNECTYFNRIWLEFTGRELEQELGRGWLDSVHPDDRERVRHEDDGHFERREPLTLEYRLRRHDGVYRWIVDEGVPRFDADGTFVGYIGACIDIDDRRRAEVRERFLADASTLLAASLDVDTTLESIARLAVPLIADWCSIAIREDDGTIRNVAVAHRDPDKIAWARELQGLYPADPDAPRGAAAVIRTGTPELLADIPESLIEEALSERPELIEPLRELGFRSSLAVPLVVRDRVIGALTLVTAAESGRLLGEEDLGLAGDVARRAAVAVENARLFEHTEFQRTLLESQGEASLDGLLVLSADGRVLSANNRFAEIWELDEALQPGGDGSATLRELAARAVDPARFLARIEELGNRGDSAREQVPLRDGRTLERYGAPVIGPDGIDHGYLWSFRDVTEQVRAGERVAFLGGASELLSESLDLQETLTRLAALAIPALADFCVFDVLDAGGEIRQVAAVHRSSDRGDFSVAMARHVAPLEHEGHPVSKAIRTRRTQLVTEVDDSWLDAMAVDRAHADFVRSLGVTSFLVVPLRLGKRPIGAVTFAFADSGRSHGPADVSLAEELARRAAMAIENARLYAEAEGRAQAAQALEFVGDGVFLVDAAGVVRLWNPAAERITGLAAAELLGSPAGAVLAAWPLGEVGERQHTYPVETGGRELWLALTAVPFEQGTVYAFRDLTEEQALEQLKNDFVSTVSHELRTPLAAIYGAAMTLQRTDVSLAEEQRQGLLSVVSNESERLARIVNDVLWASRLDSGVLDVSIENCDASVLAGAVVAAAKTHLPGGIELALETRAGTPAVAADPDKVRQVLVNLVDNAIKYSPDGGLVEVRVEPAGRTVRFLVSDRGLGIPAAEHGRIFEKFFRLDPNLTRGVGGTGLGLYICRELVLRMGGRIWVESEEGTGSTFAFELPVASEARPA